MHQQPPCLTASFSKAGHIDSDNSLTVKCLFTYLRTLDSLRGSGRAINLLEMCRARAEITHSAYVNNLHMDRDRQLAGLAAQPSERHKHIRARGYIGSSALGISDGLLTNLVFLSGFAGAISDIQLIRLAGIASMLAGAISMSFAGFLAQRSEYDLYHADAKREAGEIEQEPEEEKSELKNFYIAKGLSQDEAEKIVEKISTNKAKFLEDILMHELHVHETRLENPIKMGGVIGFSFLVGALIPLAPFILLPTKNTSILAAALIAPLFLFGVGVWRGRIVGRKIWRSGLETLIIGVAASAVLYLIGTALVFV